MAFDQHGPAPIGAKPSGIGVQHRHGILADLKPVVIEEHVAQCIAVGSCTRRDREIRWWAARWPVKRALQRYRLDRVRLDRLGLGLTGLIAGRGSNFLTSAARNQKHEA